MKTPEKSVKEIVEAYTKPQELVNREGKKIGESHWSPYCIEQFTKAIKAERQKQEEVYAEGYKQGKFDAEVTAEYGEPQATTQPNNPKV